MFGGDWLGEHGCAWDFAHSTININGSAPIPVGKRHTLRCKRVILQRNAVRPLGNKSTRLRAQHFRQGYS